MGCDGINDAPCTNNPDWERVGTSGFVMLLPYLEQQSLYDTFDFNDGPWHISSTTWLAKNAEAIARRPPIFVCASDTSKKTVAVSSGGLTVNAATGSYAFVHGSMGPSYGISGNMKVNNTGVFVYKNVYAAFDVLDGLSNTIFVGETIDADTNLSRNIWSQAGRHESSLRSTENPPNTEPGTGITTSPYGIPLYGGFGSRHPGGVQFLFGDGSTTLHGSTRKTMTTLAHRLLPLVIVAAGLAAGCGQDRPDRVRVSGQVLIDGQPLTCGFVRIMAENARPATGTIGPDGRFTLTSFDKEDGCVPSKHPAMVLAVESVGANAQRWHAPQGVRQGRDLRAGSRDHRPHRCAAHRAELERREAVRGTVRGRVTQWHDTPCRDRARGPPSLNKKPGFWAGYFCLMS